MLRSVLSLLLASSVTATASSWKEAEALSGERCYHKYVTVSVVKQVPSYSKHCTKVDDTKCKTVFKNAFTTQMETQCTPTFDTSCEPTLETAYRQQCKTIKDVECRIVNIEKYGKHHQKKICNEVPVQKCVPVPVKVEGQKCVNVPTQSCETVPVVATVSVPQKQCYKKPRKVCQTLVTTKPKVVTEQVPQEVCSSSAPLAGRPQKAKKQPGHPAAPKKDGKLFHGGGPRLRLEPAGSGKVPVYEAPSISYKKEDIPLYEEEGSDMQEYREDGEQYGSYGQDYTLGDGGGEEEMESYGSSTVVEEVEYDEYREREEARAADLHNYYKQLRGQQPSPDNFFYQGQHEPYFDQVDRALSNGPQFGPGGQTSLASLMGQGARPSTEGWRAARVAKRPSGHIARVESDLADSLPSPSARVEAVVRPAEDRAFLAGDIADAAIVHHLNTVKESYQKNEVV